MIAICELLVGPAQEAGIKIPASLDNFNRSHYPHWAVYCNMQLGRQIPNMIEHWNNAKIVADISDAIIREITCKQVEDLGFV